MTPDDARPAPDVALRRVQVFDGDGDAALDVRVYAPDADFLTTFLTDLAVGDVYDDPAPAPDVGRLEATIDEAPLPKGWRIYSIHQEYRHDRPNWPRAWSVIAHEDADVSNTIAVHERRGSLADAIAALATPEARKWAHLPEPSPDGES